MIWNEERERIIAAAELGDATPQVAADLLVAARKRAFDAEAAHTWIKTSERKPEVQDGSCCDVLVFSNGHILVLNYTNDDSAHQWADEFSNLYRNDEVSHWMPLPEAPK